MCSSVSPLGIRIKASVPWYKMRGRYCANPPQNRDDQDAKAFQILVLARRAHRTVRRRRSVAHVSRNNVKALPIRVKSVNEMFELPSCTHMFD